MWPAGWLPLPSARVCLREGVLRWLHVRVRGAAGRALRSRAECARARVRRGAAVAASEPRANAPEVHAEHAAAFLSALHPHPERADPHGDGSGPGRPETPRRHGTRPLHRRRARPQLRSCMQTLLNCPVTYYIVRV